MRQIEEVLASDGYPLRYYVWDVPDATEVVFFVHGVMSHSLWAGSQLESICTSGRKVVGIERRGAGINTLDIGDAPSVQQLLEDIDLVVAREAGGRASHIWGWCLGGVIALNFARYTRRHLSSLILAAPSIFPTDTVVERERTISAGLTGPSPGEELPLAVHEDDFTDGPQLKSFILKDELRLRSTTARFYEIQKKLSQAAMVSLMRRDLQLPTILILGAGDTVVDNVKTQEVFSRLPDCRTIYLDARHGIQFERGAELTQTILDWLSGRSEVRR